MLYSKIQLLERKILICVYTRFVPHGMICGSFECEQILLDKRI